jgi:hypothetical protein
MVAGTNARQVPATTQSQLNQTMFWSANPCFSDHTKGSSVSACTFGDVSSKTSIVTYGDSYSEEWGQVFDEIGREDHLKVIEIGRRGCPFAQKEVSNSDGIDHNCLKFRSNAIAFIESLMPAPKLIIVSQLENLTGPSGIYGSITVPQWAAASATTVAQLSKKAPVAVILGEPEAKSYPSTCLAIHLNNPNSCDPKWDLGYLYPQVIAAEMKAGAAIFNVAPLLCVDEARCPAMVNNTPVFSGLFHVTANYAIQLKPALLELMGCSPLSKGATAGTADIFRSFFPQKATRDGSEQCSNLLNLTATFK